MENVFVNSQLKMLHQNKVGLTLRTIIGCVLLLPRNACACQCVLIGKLAVNPIKCTATGRELHLESYLFNNITLQDNFCFGNINEQSECNYSLTLWE